MRIKKSDLFSARECIATFMAVKKAKYPEEVEQEILRKLFLFTKFHEQKGRSKKESKDVTKARIVQDIQDRHGPMTVEEAIELARGMRGLSEEILAHGWLSEREAKELKAILDKPDKVRRLFPVGEHKHAVSRGKKALKSEK